MTVKNQEQLEFLYKFIYSAFVQAIDGNDNGVDEVENGQFNYNKTATTLAARIRRYNILYDFDTAVQLAGQEFTDYLKWI